MPSGEFGGRRSTAQTRRPSSALPGNAVGAERRRQRRIGWLSAVLLAMVATQLAVRGAWFASSAEPIPAELIGTWETDDPRYAGRALEFQPGALILHLGEAGARAYSVRRVKRESTSVVIHYDIRQWDGEVEDVLTLEYRPGRRVIELARPDGVLWRPRVTGP